MTQTELIKRAQNGDVLLVKSDSAVGKAIRCLTGESYSHVAVLVWVPGLYGFTLRVYEFAEGVGHQTLPLDDWLAQRESQALFYGVAPEPVHAAPTRARTAAEYYTTASRLQRGYGYLSLVKVWLSQLIRCRIPVRQKVCSTYAQEIWRAAGFDAIGRTADPGDIAEHCQTLYPLWR
ncbi:C40 family peptidase [Syntrophotalea acetylenica]|uniref:Permuted papain-like amidase enzyme, YaeF/YiiX, C92 family n=1 Tax=Syntrophotalea acetylenica TaxID=29542 RepID=A0A1L3GDS1_SYNAC|nr:hypothetical protein [Syntrophotalea acetylenica]APG24101.1 hypothetical protein A7E75_02935 [Syntrophotalea acetylenica]APG44683.1 hypothetical protein A6070_11560 [Syntrophotalea acetylenica]